MKSLGMWLLAALFFIAGISLVLAAEDMGSPKAGGSAMMAEPMGMMNETMNGMENAVNGVMNEMDNMMNATSEEMNDPANGYLNETEEGMGEEATAPSEENQAK